MEVISCKIAYGSSFFVGKLGVENLKILIFLKVLNLVERKSKNIFLEAQDYRIVELYKFRRLRHF